MVALFAGGCFWCLEAAFEKRDGVIKAVSGYAGGQETSVTYKDYAQKGHVEVVQVHYDPSVVSYNELLDLFWRNIDPTDSGGQFNDRGPQYRSIIFYGNDQEENIARRSKQELEASKRFSKPISTEIKPIQAFYKAEDYHQNYAKNNPVRYYWYRYWSRRDSFFKRIWGK